jgi:hypothetical protein
LNYLRVWLTAIGLAVLLLGGWEGFWRARGFTPAANDDVGWWALSRDAADRVGPEGVVLVGSSRMQLGFDTRAFAAATGIHPVQLAIDGDSGIEVLQDLANDPRFHGTVICEFMEKYLVTLGADPTGTQADDWLREYHAANLFGRFEWRARGATQTAFAFRLPDLSAQSIAGSLRFKRLPRTPYLRMYPDRFKPADYASSDLEMLRTRHQNLVRYEFAHMPPLSPAEFVERGRRVADWAAQIEARGGRVIFVRFPTSGEIRKLEDGRFPKAEFWDRLVAEDHLTAVHFADYPALSGFSGADGTHLDRSDATRFTTALAGVLREQNLIPAAGN